MSIEYKLKFVVAAVAPTMTYIKNCFEFLMLNFKVSHKVRMPYRVLRLKLIEEASLKYRTGTGISLIVYVLEYGSFVGPHASMPFGK